MFKALLVSEAADGSFHREILERPLAALPSGDVLIRVLYSSLNYKDALSATGNKGVTRKYPHVPGVDAAGIVERSQDTDFQSGDEVLVTGYDLGSNTDGGWSEYIRVPAHWVVKRPDKLTLRETMIYGTAGFTAGLAAYKLLHHKLRHDAGPVLVTGATGGVGCMAVALLAQLGFHVVAVTGKKEEKSFLLGLGAKDVVGREEVREVSNKPLLTGRWGGVVDTVGGGLLETALRQTKLEGIVACCGNIASAELHTSIYPFILRGITLAGIGSAFTPMETRLEVWKNLAGIWKLQNLEEFAVEVSLSEVNEKYVDMILKGGMRGRVVVDTQRI